MATATQMAAYAQLNQSKSKAKRARTQGGKLSIEPNSPQAYQSQVEGRDEVLERAEPINQMIHPVDNSAARSGHVGGVQAKQTAADVSRFLAQRNRTHVEAQAAKLKASRIPEFGVVDRVGGQDRQLQEYSRLNRQLSVVGISDQLTRRAQARQNKLASQIQKNIKSKEKVKDFQRKLAWLYEGNAIGSTPFYPGPGPGWGEVVIGGATDMFQILKLVLGKETVFVKWEPPKLDLTKPDAYVVLMHGGIFMIIFVGIIFTGGMMVAAFFGAVLLQLGFIASIAGAFMSIIT